MPSAGNWEQDRATPKECDAGHEKHCIDRPRIGTPGWGRDPLFPPPTELAVGLATPLSLRPHQRSIRPRPCRNRARALVPPPAIPGGKAARRVMDWTVAERQVRWEPAFPSGAVAYDLPRGVPCRTTAFARERSALPQRVCPHAQRQYVVGAGRRLLGAG